MAEDYTGRHRDDSLASAAKDDAAHTLETTGYAPTYRPRHAAPATRPRTAPSAHGVRAVCACAVCISRRTRMARR